jgi:hypothetical protein
VPGLQVRGYYKFGNVKLKYELIWSGVQSLILVFKI